MYPITIWKKEGRYYGEVPALSLLASDDDPSALVQTLETQIDELSKTYAEAGRELASPTPERDDFRRLKIPFYLFTAKTAVVAAAASIVIVLAIDTLSDKIRHGFFDGALGPFHLVDKIGTRLETMPPHIKEKTLKELEKMVNELEPYVDRIRPLVQDRNTETKPSTPRKP
ncbi:MAG: hypothetical protein OQK24_07630 [Magnetovibrio sp.]|nr:hypothetical protein [Magnetovibrio sp.]